MKTSRWQLPLWAGLVLGAASAGCAALPPAWSPDNPPTTPLAAAGIVGRQSLNEASSSRVVRGQAGGYAPSTPAYQNSPTPGSTSHMRYPMPAAGVGGGTVAAPLTAPGIAAPTPQFYGGGASPNAPAPQYYNGAIYGGAAATPPPQPYTQAPPQPYNGAVYGGAGAPSGYAPPPTVAPLPPPTVVSPLPPPAVVSPLPPPQGAPYFAPGEAPYIPPSAIPPDSVLLAPPPSYADIDVIVDEARTGRFMVGVGVNSDAGVTGQIVVDERNFDITRPPTSFADIINGTAWRGAGQGFRFEAIPGSELQRYLVTFTEPYLFDTPVSFSLSGYYFDRRYFDWTETRIGGRMGLGYRITHDLSLATSFRAESVEIRDPRVRGVPQLERVLGENELYTSRVSLTHDTRDIPFAPTEGHYLELAYEQGFGTFDYPRGEVDYRQYFLLRERPDGSGRHTLSYAFRLGFSGEETPLFENFFAGGHTTLRGFDFRGASPVNMGVIVGGRFQMLGSVEYLFPLTADDMLKGVLFTDFGTVEEEIELNSENYRVAPGFGLRIAVPAMGPAPIALDFAFPVAMAPTDDERMFSFFVGFGR